MNHPKIDPQMVAASARNDELLRSFGPAKPGIEGARQHFARAREWWNEGGPAVARTLDATVPGPEREIPVRVYIPADTGRPLPAYIYFHGGGFRLGSPGSHDRQLRELAMAWRGIVVSADYAHMPEKRFPAPPQEAAAVYDWIARSGSQWGIDPGRLAFGGSSAGANVAIGGFEVAGPQARDALRCAAFIVGVFDDAVDTGTMQRYGATGLQPSAASARQMFEEYAGTAENRHDPRFNALLQDPSRWPPLFLAAAEVDVFRDSSVRLAACAQAAGVPATLRVYAGMTHLFFGYTRTVDRAQACLLDLADFLRRQLPP